eukprot:jgi/Tetstr1/431965/TSEL_021442.t1
MSATATLTAAQQLPHGSITRRTRSPTPLAAARCLPAAHVAGFRPVILLDRRLRVPLRSRAWSSAGRLATVRVSAAAEAGAEGIAPPTVKVHWCSRGKEYSEWGLHVWGAAREGTAWEAPLAAEEVDDFGAVWTVPTKTWTIGQDGDTLGLLIHKGEEKDVELYVDKNDILQLFDPRGGSQLEVWAVSGSNQLFLERPDLDALPVGDLYKFRAHWVARDVLAWRVDAGEGAAFALHASYSAGLEVAGSAPLAGDGDAIPLSVDPAGLPEPLAARFPFLAGCACLRLPAGVDVDALVRCQLAVSKVDAASGKMADCTGVQLPGVLDECFAYDGPLGCAIGDDKVEFAVWAPTCRSVELLVYDAPRGGSEESMPMTRGADGVWRAEGPPVWAGRYYVYRVTVFHPATNHIETAVSADPASLATSADGQRSHIADICAPELMPAGWDDLAKPPLEHHADAAIYELHVRDFSVLADDVPAEARGKYVAFESDCAGTRHLAALADSGLTHVHLLPTYDFGTVPELPSDRSDVDAAALAAMPPDSEEQQAAVMAVADTDSFNWGYDPVLYAVPEGSYATDGAIDGACRSLEFRRMVAAINRLGLRVVLDVVYNHLLSSGPHGDKSIYDKIVPGYYIRRSEDGAIENSTCCNNTASENYMMDRLIVDDLVHWAVNYKVDGFRFDLMGHIMMSTLNRARAALDALTLENDGVDGKKILMYGEGWEFGEVANCARGVNGSQPNLGGSGIGSFNDRIREPSVGGGPFGDPRIQGFATGLYLAPWPADSEVDQGSVEQQLPHLLLEMDKIRLGLAGNLSSYTLEDCNGAFVRGDVAHGGGIAYAKEPAETVNYVSAHDNETLFDLCVLKMPAPLRSTEERIRASWLCTSLVALAHGIPFFHAGDELLRSKSLDRDSYNSGDWFNRLDFTGETHNLGVGLPPAGKNSEKWHYMRGMLADAERKPTKAQILATAEKLKELLRVRGSTALLGLRSSGEIMQRVRFPNTGRKQLPGLIVMEVVDKGWSGEEKDVATRFATLPQLCDKFSRVVVAFNARPEAVEYALEDPGTLELHPLQASSSDPVVAGASVEAGKLVVPALTAAVFVETR